MLSLAFLPHGCIGSWNVCLPYPTQFCLIGTSMAISLIPEEFGKETLYLLTFSFFMQMDSRIFCRNQNIIIRKDNKSGRFSVKSLYGLLSPTHYPNNDFSFAGRGGAREGLAGAPAPARNFFSSPSLNDIYNFSLSSKAIKILAPLNFIFYFHHCLLGSGKV